MRNGIRMNEWREFLKVVSTEQQEWKTKIEILSNELGDQILTEGLPLNGISIGTRAEPGALEIVVFVGGASGAHHSHTIKDPRVIAFFQDIRKQRVVLDIEDKEGTRTLIALEDPITGAGVDFSDLDSVNNPFRKREYRSTAGSPRGIL